MALAAEGAYVFCGTEKSNIHKEKTSTLKNEIKKIVIEIDN